MGVHIEWDQKDPLVDMLWVGIVVHQPFLSAGSERLE